MRLGEVERPHPRHEDPCRLRSPSDLPRILDITHANVNDAQIGRTIGIVSGATYVFDKGYCPLRMVDRHSSDRGLLRHAAEGNMGLRVVKARDLRKVRGDGFTVLDDEEVVFASKGDSKLPMPLRRIRVKRHNGKDDHSHHQRHERSAVGDRRSLQGALANRAVVPLDQTASQYPQVPRQQRECHRLQILAAMIAYALLRLAARTHKVAHPILRFTDLVRQFLFERAISPPSKSPHPSIRAANKTKARPIR